LDHYLAQFIARAQENGVIVHRAATAAQAIQIVLQIAQAQGSSPLAAKSKSMVSEEIHLNPALEAAGVRVVETDLGEYIIQLRGEPPSHLITPAVHLRRQQVGQLFAEKLGVPYTEDISVMTNTARRVLRQVFLDAQIGISGVNMGVAATGTLALLTNEGNGRMVTTLPRIHIALMGMERLVPTLDDLAVILQLLPRSATGQKLTVYTSLVHGPRRSSDPDGPTERHLVILDNGRSALRNSPLEEALYCVRCGACLNACPVFRELGGHAYVSIHGQHAPYPGPIGSVISPGLLGASEFGHLARASTLCGACQENCPVDINLPALLLRIRAGQVAPAGRPGPAPVHPNPPALLAWGLRLFSQAAAHPRWFGWAQKLAGLGGWLLSPRSTWLRLPAFTGWGYRKDFPRPASATFRERWRRGQVSAGNLGAVERDAPRHLVPVSPCATAAPMHLTTWFGQELTALNGQMISCTPAELPTKILNTLSQLGEKCIQSWSAEHLPAGLVETLQAAGIVLTPTADPTLSVGLTGAVSGVAETGSVLITSGAGQPLTASLLPAIHLVVLRAATIYAHLAQALNLEATRQASLSVLITGPSRTADIEMTLTLGVHGPGQVIVFCVQDLNEDTQALTS